MSSGVLMRAWQIFVAFACMSVVPAQGQPVSTLGPFLVLPDDSSSAIMDGDIATQTATQFSEFIALNPGITSLSLNSNGGSVSNGLRVADLVHDLRIATYVPIGSGCYSACAYIFLAGNQRLVLGELGVHQFRYSNAVTGGAERGQSDAQVAMAEILDRLTRFNVHSEVIHLMLITPPEDMYVFSTEEISRFALNIGGARPPTVPRGEMLPLPTSTPPTMTTTVAAPGDTCWNHNGSLMRLRANGNGRVFTYEVPRSGMVAAGVVPDTVLFDGVRSGSGYAGTSRVFGACGATPYSVQGAVDANQTTVTLKGIRPLLDACRPTSVTREDTLVFTYVGRCATVSPR